MNFAEYIARSYPRKMNIWDIFSSVLGGKTFGKGNLSKADFCNTYKYSGALSKSRIIRTDEFPHGTLESELVAYWLIQNISKYKSTLENWKFNKRDYGIPHKKTVPRRLPSELPENKLSQVRYEKYIEMWLYEQYRVKPLPATIYDASLTQIKQSNIGSCIGYEQYLKTGSGEAIDLISLLPRSKRPKLYLLELKAGCSKETLLRCLLEAYTYAKMIKPEWQSEFRTNLGIMDDNPQIVICPLFFDTKLSRQNEDLLNAIESSTSQIRELAKKIEDIESGRISIEFARLDPRLLTREIQTWLDFEKKHA